MTLLLSIPLFGQQGSIELRGTAGWTGFADEGTVDHLHLGASFRYFLTRRLGVEPEFQYLYNSAQDTDLVLLGNFAYDFRTPGARVVPYAIGGPGVFWHRFRGFGPSFTSSEVFASGGAGVKIFLSERWFVAPEFRVGWEPHVRFTVSIGRAWYR